MKRKPKTKSNIRKTKMYTKTVTISLSNIEAQIAAFLYATSVVNDDEDILDMLIADGLPIDTDGLVKLKLNLKKLGGEE